MKHKKKKAERIYLDIFFEIIKTTPEKIEESEAPDFIVDINKDRIGLEVTEFHSDLEGEKGYTRRLIEEEWRKLQRNIMKDVEKYPDLNETSGMLYFDKLELPSRSEYEQFIRELINLALKMVRTCCEMLKPGSSYPILSKYLKEINIKQVGYHSTWEWNHNVSFIGISETELLNCIKPKVDKASSYKRDNIDELWLLVASGARLSQATPVYLQNYLKSFQEVNALLTRSVFKHCYFLQYMLGIVYKWPDWQKIT